MNKKITALSVAALVGFGGMGGAYAVGAAQPVGPTQCLAEYMNDDNDAQWDKVQAWFEANYAPQSSESSPACGTAETPTPEPTETEAPEPEPTADPEPTEAPSALEGDVVWTESGVKFSGKIAGTKSGDRVQIRVDTKPIADQRGFYEYEFVKADGTVSFTLADYRTPQDKLYWQIEKGGTAYRHGEVVASGVAEKPTTNPAPAPEPTPTEEPTAEPTENPDGPVVDFKNEEFASFTANGITAKYHLYTEGLDTSKPIGMMVYGDGSAEYGLENPRSSYLLAGPNGLREVAKKHNMVLLTPMAPGDNCTDGDGDCWYGNSREGITPTQKTDWAAALIKKVQADLNVDKSRVALGGYSSGAQWVSQFLAPRHGVDIMTDGVVVPISYGGAPRVDTNFTQAFKDNVVFSWDSGKNDAAYSSVSWGAIGGYNWYKNNGFTTQANWIDGKGHGRSGEFGAVMDREITEHIG